MAIAFACPHCGKSYQLADNMAGRQGICTQCAESFRIPHPAEGPQPEAPPSYLPLQETTAGKAEAGHAATQSVEMPPVKMKKKRPRRRFEDHSQERAISWRNLTRKQFWGLVGGVSGFVLLLVLAWWWLSSPGISRELYYLPDNAQVIAVMDLEALNGSEAFRRFKEEAKITNAEIDVEFLRVLGVKFSQISRAVLGGNFGEATDVVLVLRLNAPITIDTILASKRRDRFERVTINRDEVHEGQQEAYCVPDDRTVVLGTPEAVRKVLRRGRKASLSPGTQAALGKTDLGRVLSVAVDIRDLQPKKNAVLQRAFPPAWAPLFDAEAFALVADVREFLGVTATMVCRDADHAEDLKSLLEGSFQALRRMPGASRNTVQVLEMCKVTTSGANLTASATVPADLVTEPLLALGKATRRTFGPAPGPDAGEEGPPPPAGGAGPGTVQELIEEFKQPNENRRGLAVLRMKEFGANAVPELSQALNHADRNVRIHAAKALALLGPASSGAVPGLIAVLQNSDDQVRLEAAVALEKIGPGARRAYPDLLLLLADGNNDVRRAAETALAKLGDPTRAEVPVLMKALRNENQQVRLYAIGALVKVGADAKATLPAVLEGVGDASPERRADFTAALKKMGLDQTDLPALQTALKSPKPSVRAVALDLVATIRLPAGDAAPIFVSALKDSDKGIREQAAVGLGQVGVDAHGTSLPPLIETLKDPEREVRQAAQQALQKIGPAGAADLPLLKEKLGDREPAVRGFATRAMGQVGPAARDYVPLLVALLKDDDPDLRRASAEALGKIGRDAKAAVPALAKALQDQDTEVRTRAVAALEQIGRQPQTVAALFQALKDSDEAVARRAVEALKKIGPLGKEDVPILREGLQSPQALVRSEAIQALGQLGAEAKDALPEFIAAVGDKESIVKLRAIQALGSLAGDAKDAVPALVKALAEKDEAIRGAAIKTLGEIGPPAKAAIPGLILLLGDSACGNLAADSLANIGTDAVKPLAQELNATDKQVRLRAVQTLGRIGPRAKSAVLDLSSREKRERDREVRAAIKDALRKVQVK
jgi:HEAT repeat protein